MNHERRMILKLIERYCALVGAKRQLMHEETKIDLERQAECETYLTVIQDLRDLLEGDQK